MMGLSGCFLFGTEQQDYNLTYIPPNEFLLGPEDILVVNVWRNQELSREVIVRPDGKISMPLVGDVQAAEPLSGDTDDSERPSANRNRMSDDVGAGMQAPLPEDVAHHDDRLGTGAIVAFAQRSAHRRAAAEH